MLGVRISGNVRRGLEETRSHGGGFYGEAGRG